MSRESFQATPELRRRVRYLARLDLSHDDIAILIGCSAKTLRKHFPEELEMGPSEGKATIADGLFQAIRDGDTASTIFAYKTRVMGKKSVRVVEDEAAQKTEEMPEVLVTMPFELRGPVPGKWAQAIIDIPGAPPDTPPIFIYQEPYGKAPITHYPKEWLKPVGRPKTKRVRIEEERGRKPFRATGALREKVRRVAVLGLPHENIAALIGCSAKTLRKCFRGELDRAMVEHRLFITEALMRLAGGGNSAARICLTKAFLKWGQENHAEDAAAGSAQSPQAKAPPLDDSSVQLPRALFPVQWPCMVAHAEEGY